MICNSFKMLPPTRFSREWDFPIGKMAISWRILALRMRFLFNNWPRETCPCRTKNGFSALFPQSDHRLGRQIHHVAAKNGLQKAKKKISSRGCRGFQQRSETQATWPIRTGDLHGNHGLRRPNMGCPTCFPERGGKKEWPYGRVANKQNVRVLVGVPHWTCMILFFGGWRNMNLTHPRFNRAEWK